MTDGMKAAGLPLDVVAYSAPQGLHAVSAAGGRGQPGSILILRNPLYTVAGAGTAAGTPTPKSASRRVW